MDMYAEPTPDELETPLGGTQGSRDDEVRWGWGWDGGPPPAPGV